MSGQSLCQRTWVPHREGSGFQIKPCTGCSRLCPGDFFLGARLAPPNKFGEQGCPLCWQNMPRGA